MKHLSKIFKVLLLSSLLMSVVPARNEFNSNTLKNDYRIMERSSNDGIDCNKTH